MSKNIHQKIVRSYEIKDAIQKGGLCTAAEASRILNISKVAVYNKLNNGQIVEVNFGGRRYCGFISVVALRFGLDCEQVSDAISDWISNDMPRPKKKVINK